MGKIRTLRNTIKDIIVENDLVPESRIKLGYNVFADTGNVDFLNNLQIDGYYVVIHKGHSPKRDNFTGAKEIEIKVTLYYGFNKNEDYTYEDVQDTIEEIEDAILLEENWDDISNPPKDVSTEETNLTTDSTVIAKSVDMTFTWETV